MRTALDKFYIRGVSHNIPFLASLLGKQRFVDGKLTTNFIAEEYAEGFNASDLPPEDPTTLVCVATAVNHLEQLRAAQISDQMKGHERKVGSDYVVRIGDDDYHAVSIAACEKSGGWSVLAGGRTHTVESTWTFGQPLWVGHVDGHHLVIQVDRAQKGLGYQLFHQGAVAEIKVYDPRTAELAKLMPIKLPPDMSKYLLSPMPGLLVSIEVADGQEVKAGEKLAVVEAMKMENVLRAEQDGTIKKIHAEAGASLAVDQIIIEFE
jgi:propionyl-CoA carboxylase alpha chain